MRTIIRNKQSSKHHSRRFGKIVLLILALLFSVLICTYAHIPISLVRFFNMMREVTPWTTVQVDEIDTYSLDELKQVSGFLLEQSERDRRLLIASYDFYALTCTDDLSHPSNLYLLLRVLFDVPNEYPMNQARFFGSWEGPQGEPGPVGSETISLLWPLGYQDQQLILVGTLRAYVGAPYDGLAEYDYFASNFPLRSIDDFE